MFCENDDCPPYVAQVAQGVEPEDRERESWDPYAGVETPRRKPQVRCAECGELGNPND